MLTVAAMILAGCMTSNNQGAARPPPPAVLEQIRQVDLSPRSTQSIIPVETTDSSQGPRAATYLGDGTPAIAGAPPGTQANGRDDGPATTGTLAQGTQAANDGQGYEMNFENTPVATVAKAILGDILGLGYTIDPRVQATVSLSSGRAVPKKDILFVLESALRVSNVALVREAQSYRLVPTAEAVGTGSIDRSARVRAGYGITVVPLQYVSAQTLTKLLENFASQARNGTGGSIAKLGCDPRQRRRPPCGHRYRAQLRCGLDARPIGGHLSW